MHKEFFACLSIKDIDKSREFFRGMGFSFDPKYTYANALCIVIRKKCYVLLINEPIYKKIVVKDQYDPFTHKVSHINITLSSKKEVDAYIKKAVKLGATEHQHQLDMEDYNFMYFKGFSDLDGHLWMLTYFP